MREPKSKEITGARQTPVTYTVHLIAPTQALDLLLDLVRMVGPGLAPVLANVGTLSRFMDRDVTDLNTDFLGEAVRALTAGVDKEMTKSVIKRLAAVTVVHEGDSSQARKLDATFELHFAQEGLGAMFAWVWFALQTQYDDFLGAFGSAIKSVSLPSTSRNTKN